MLMRAVESNISGFKIIMLSFLLLLPLLVVVLVMLLLLPMQHYRTCMSVESSSVHM